MLSALVTLAMLATTGCNGVVEMPEWIPRPVPDPVPLCDPENPSVGDTPLRRITRSQYQHAVEDVLFVEGEFSSLLALDERVGNFSSNVAVAVDRVMLEQYMDGAETVVAAVDISDVDDCNLLAEDPVDCATRFLRTFGVRMFRRPLLLVEEQRLLSLYVEYGTASHADGIRMMLRSMLVSPNFLYHDDYQTTGEPNGELIALEAHAVATRMAFFLWDSVPDDELLAAAADGSLDDVAGIRAQAQRMIVDPRSSRGIGTFHRGWLGLAALPSAERDATMFPTFDEALVEAMIEETERFANHVIREGDGSLTTLLTASWSIIPAGMQAYYGLPASTPTDAPVELDPTQRAGILTHASVLATHAHNQQSSLTLRGKLIREEVFCHALPEPPDDVDITLPEVGPGATTRERFEAHVAMPSCASCHQATDPIGFAYEHYDAIGRWRDDEFGRPIDALGELTDTDVDAELDGAPAMAEALAASREVERCVARQWFRYAVGRRESVADACSLAEMDEAMEAPDNLRALLVAIVSSDAFRHRHNPTGEE